MSPGGEAEALQARLAALPRPAAVDLSGIRTVAGLDVAYDPDSERVAGAVVVLDAKTLDTLEMVTHRDTAAFPYLPGLLAFREMPPLLAALGKLSAPPDVLVCDGYGIAHPRRFGLACHLGYLTGLPTFGVAKTPFTGTHQMVGENRGDQSDLTEDGEVLGRVVRTRDGVKPVFVSVGWAVDLDDACRLTLDLCRVSRLPETTRRADRASRDALKR